MIEGARIAALIAVLSAAVIYGTDVFCAVVQKPALARVNDWVLVAVMGNVHYYGDRRMPVPGVLGIVSAAVSSALAALSGRWIAAGAAATAVGLLLIWLVAYLRVSAPINRRLVAAAKDGDLPPDARALQSDWDRVITTRAVLQGFAIAALCLTMVHCN
ncbi:MAG: DUF1772 domain-containing protein [Mycobacteriaceae bacterium]|nr:DUF1772 domain-containing protein [Mycobacteriaceae bacterium]